VLLSGYSCGSAIASAVIAQLPPGCAARSPCWRWPARCGDYTGGLPAYFGGDQLATLVGPAW